MQTDVINNRMKPINTWVSLNVAYWQPEADESMESSDFCIDVLLLIQLALMGEAQSQDLPSLSFMALAGIPGTPEHNGQLGEMWEVGEMEVLDLKRTKDNLVRGEGWGCVLYVAG